MTRVLHSMLVSCLLAATGAPLASAQTPLPPSRPANEMPRNETPLPPPRPGGEAPSQPPASPTAPAPALPVLGPPAPPPSALPLQACLDQLRARGFQAEAASLPPNDNAQCTVEQPVRISAISIESARIALPDQPIVACATARVFADFVGQLLVPLAKGTFDQAIVAIGTGPGFECRPRNGVAGARTSAHGQGLALDIAQLRFANGRSYNVGSPADERDKAFDTAVRAGACGYFHTELGPGADEAHADHWHMDLEPRGSNGTSKFCQ